MTRSVHDRFNCIFVNFDRTQHSVYMIHNFIKSIMSLAITFLELNWNCLNSQNQMLMLCKIYFTQVLWSNTGSNDVRLNYLGRDRPKCFDKIKFSRENFFAVIIIDAIFRKKTKGSWVGWPCLQHRIVKKIA